MHLFTQSALLKALGWSLFNSLWQMALLWLLYRILITVFKNMSSHSRHNLAIGLLSLGSLGCGIEFIAGYFFMVPAPDGAATWPEGWLPAGNPGVLWQQATQYINAALPWCSSLYLLVLGVLLARYSQQYFHSQKLKHTGLSKMQPELRVFMAETMHRMGIRKPVQAWLSSLVDVPLTLGFIKPVILLPVAMANHLTLQQTEAILLHELAHIRRNDYLLHLGVMMLELLFFFNPFARLLIREVKREREHRCDDWVMQFRYDPQTYISALLSLASHYQRLQPLALAATGGGSDRLLLHRVRRILQQKKDSDHSNERSNARPVILLLFIIAASIFGLSRTPFPATAAGKNPTNTPVTIGGPAGTNVYTVTAGANVYAITRVITGHPVVPSPVTPSPMPGFLEAALPRELPVTGSVLPTSPEIVAKIHFSEVIISRRPGRGITTRKPHSNPMASPPAGADDQPGENLDEYSETVLPTVGDANGPIAEEYATAVQPDERDYSIGSGSGTAIAGHSRAAQKRRNNALTFVPNSSFSFQYTEDSTRPEEQMIYLQQSTQQEIGTAIRKMQDDMIRQLQILQQTQAQMRLLETAGKTRQQFHAEQLKIQQQYRQKLTELQHKLETVNRRLRIVYI